MTFPKSQFLNHESRGNFVLSANWLDWKKRVLRWWLSGENGCQPSLPRSSYDVDLTTFLFCPGPWHKDVGFAAGFMQMLEYNNEFLQKWLPGHLPENIRVVVTLRANSDSLKVSLFPWLQHVDWLSGIAQILVQVFCPWTCTVYGVLQDALDDRNWVGFNYCTAGNVR